MGFWAVGGDYNNLPTNREQALFEKLEEKHMSDSSFSDELN
jgi:hypothetical protein